jgi:hypothetical protein
VCAPPNTSSKQRAYLSVLQQLVQHEAGVLPLQGVCRHCCCCCMWHHTRLGLDFDTQAGAHGSVARGYQLCGFEGVGVICRGHALRVGHSVCSNGPWGWGGGGSGGLLGACMEGGTLGQGMGCDQTRASPRHIGRSQRVGSLGVSALQERGGWVVGGGCGC